MTYETLRWTVEKGVGYLTLDNGRRFNTLHSECIVELKRALGELEADPTIVCVVLSGGERESFAVGANIAEMKDFSSLDGFRFSELGQSLFARMEEMAKPIIGALNGIAMGGGCDLALACDVRLASDQLRIAHPGAKLGIITGFGGTQKLPRLVGRNFAREIFMTAESYDAREALHMGLVDRIFPHEEFWPRVRAFAERIAAMDPVALDYAKRLVNASGDVDLGSGRTMELGAFSTLCSAGALSRRAAAFLTRRK